MRRAVAIPDHTEMIWSALAAVQQHGGSVSIDEMTQRVIELERFTEAQQAILHGDGPETEIGYRLAWARTLLKGMGLLTNSRRGVWSLTDEGNRFLVIANGKPGKAKELIRDLYIGYRTEIRAARAKQDETSGVASRDDLERAEAPRTWKEDLLDALMELTSDAFERLAQRLLREAGFLSTTVTGRSGDGGIDGLGTYRLSLLSFPVFFQCKRYKGSVGPAAVRDFRGAMAGRGDKGLLITTGTFSSKAKSEATRDGAPPIDLVDGDRLCDLLKEFELGVQVKIRQVEDISVEQTFFDEL